MAQSFGIAIGQSGVQNASVGGKLEFISSSYRMIMHAMVCIKCHTGRVRSDGIIKPSRLEALVRGRISSHLIFLYLSIFMVRTGQGSTNP